MLCSVAVLSISGPGAEIISGALVWSIYLFSYDFFSIFLRRGAPSGLSKVRGLGPWLPKTATGSVNRIWKTYEFNAKSTKVLGHIVSSDGVCRLIKL